MAPDAVERRDWLRLSLSENVGPVTFKALIERFGSATAALAALPELSKKGGLKRSIKVYGAAEADQDLATGERLGMRMLTWRDPDFPKLLHHIDANPPVLWCRGLPELANREAIAIVGARNASALGLRFTRQIAAELGQAGLIIVSGLARGIDTAAHEASAATGTVAAVAGGVDVIYPPENRKLHAQLCERGLIVSEMKPGTVPKAEHFPRRNRIISGMARATLVIEAALRSGSLITARLAAEQGREVFAAPGSPLDPRAEGTNRLIRNGATLLTGAGDVLEGLKASIRPAQMQFFEPPPAALDVTDGDAAADQQRVILDLLSPAPADLDDIIRESHLPPRTVSSVLLELELAGRAARHPQGKVSSA